MADARIFSIIWVKNKVAGVNGIATGWIENKGNNRAYKLTYAKEDSIKLLNFIYYNRDVICLNRKYRIAERYLRVW